MSAPVIKKIGIFKSSIQLKEPFVISLGKLEHAENIIVRISDDAGFTGFGEGSPFRTIHGETTDTCLAVGSEIARAFIGKNPLSIDELSGWMDKYIYANTSIKSAFDIALHDLAAQHAGVSLNVFLGANQRHSLQTDYTVSIGTSEKMCTEAARIVKEGFPVIKVKLGENKEKDIERIRSIRGVTGLDIPIRIDANQGWNVSSAPEILNELSRYNIQHCEEPLPRRDFMHLAQIRKNSPIPVMADESCFDHHDAQRLIDLNACDSFNIKLGKSSGILKALKIIQLAESSGMPLQIGGFLESRLGFTAAAHLAMCCKELPYIDFDTPLMFSEDRVIGGIRYGNNGTVILPDSIGLGASYSDDYLDSLQGRVVQ